MKDDTRNRLLLPIVIPIGILTLIGLILFGFSRILLSVKPDAATATALIVAATVLGAAAYAASRRRVSGATIGGLLGTVAGVAMLAGGIAIVAVGPPEKAAHPYAATLVAPDKASVHGFASKTLSFPGNVPVNLTFVNQEVGQQHDVVITAGADQRAPQVFEGALVTGGQSAVYSIRPLAPGSYFFYCMVHPTTMTGKLTVSAGGGAAPSPNPSPSGGGAAPSPNPSPSNGGGGSPSAQTVSIRAVPVQKFDTSHLSWTANAAAKVMFSNQDPGQVHNFTLYRDSGHTELIGQTPLIGIGDETSLAVPGLAAGTYYFDCIVHPTIMFGTVTVS